MSNTRRSLPSQEFLNNRFYLDPEDGNLYNKYDVNYNSLAGSESGFVTKAGYKEVTIDGFGYRVHRVIWKMLYNEEPQTIDHIDRNKLNNRPENLRICTDSYNVYNVSDSRYIGESGYRGVYKHKNKWRAVSSFNSVKKHIGLYSTPEEAYAAYLEVNKCRTHI